jgi:Na+-driven multidrug efflux pump
LAMWILGLRIHLRKDIRLPLKDMFKVPLSIYKKILKVGIPTAGENLSYNIGQIVIGWMMAVMGTVVLDAYSLVITLSRYVFISSLSIGSGTQVKVGYYVGAKNEDEAYKKVFKYFLMGFAITITLIIMLNIFKDGILRIFTSNEEIIRIASSVLIVSIFLETGRNFNLIIIQGLKGAGDVRFPVIIGMISMWGIGVGGAFILGTVMKYGLMGIWIAVAIDECARGVIMFFRWKSGAWRNRGLVN